MSLALGHLGPESGVLSYMDDLICIDHTIADELFQSSSWPGTSRAL